MSNADLIALKPSRILICVIVLTHALSIAAVLSVEIGVAIALPVMLIVGFSLFWQVRCALLLTQKSITAIALTESKDQHTQLTLRLIQRDGTEQKAEVISGSYVTPFYTGIRLHVANSAWAKYFPATLSLFSDSLEAEDYRKIRVKLKWS